MLAVGSPLHAFDLSLLHGGRIVVRRAQSGEEITTLDGQHRTLTTDDLVIADADHPVAVAGIMGGWYFAVPVQGGTTGAYFSSLNALAQLPDFYMSCAKAILFGFTVGAVACYKGYHAKGGPKGVGDAVQASVVISFLLLFFQNFLITTLYFNLVPQKF
jgi:hypothetical protein